MFNKAKKFLSDVYLELHKVAWPSRQELVGSTIVVIVMSLIVSLFIGAVDFILKELVNLLISVAGS
jgi:preprotein translocase subunit SecE